MDEHEEGAEDLTFSDVRHIYKRIAFLMHKTQYLLDSEVRRRLSASDFFIARVPSSCCCLSYWGCAYVRKVYMYTYVQSNGDKRKKSGKNEYDCRRKPEISTTRLELHNALRYILG